MSGQCSNCGWDACDCVLNRETGKIEFSEEQKPKKKVKFSKARKIIIVANILQVAGWTALFCIDWRMATLVSVIVLGQTIKLCLWQGYMESTIESVLETLKNLVFCQNGELVENKKEENKNN